MSRYKEGCCGVCAAGLALERMQAAAAPSPSAAHAALLAEVAEHNATPCCANLESAIYHHGLLDRIAAALRAASPSPGFDFAAHLARQAAFSARTFGPGPRVAGVTDHIAKELREVRESGGALDEWIDVVILALDGCWRSGATPADIIGALVAKQDRNEARTWPDWRTADPNAAIEHDRSEEASPSSAPEAATLADDLEKLSMTLPPVCDRERDAIKALAKRLRAASPSPGAVEAAYREGYRAGWHEGYNGSSSLPRAAMTNGEDRSWQASAARRVAEGGQDG